MKKRNSENSMERLAEENKKLRAQVNSYKKEIKKLRSELKTSAKAWDETEDFLKNVTEGRSLKEVIKDVNLGKGLRKLDNSCVKCKSSNISTMKYPSFRILVCADCEHKQKIEERYTDEQE